MKKNQVQKGGILDASLRGDQHWVARTLVLAARGKIVSPNPQVGCVIVKNDRVIAEGWHQYFGGPHAEIEALKKAGSRARGATLYTNLEPCAHWGKTPPCALAVERAGIRRVVSAMSDPNPLVRGKGFRYLRSKGIEVRSSILQKEAQDLNRAFLCWIEQKRPWVIAKAALSLDGKEATHTGDSKWITGQAARQISHQLRQEVDAILIGAGTLRADNPGLLAEAGGRHPLRVVLAGKQALPKKCKLWNAQARTLVYAGRSVKFKVPKNVEVDVLPERGGKMEIKTLLKNLSERGVSKLLVEGGGVTLSHFFEARLVDELYFFMAPLLIGGAGAPTPWDGIGVQKIADALRLEKITMQPLGQDFVLHARIQKK